MSSTVRFEMRVPFELHAEIERLAAKDFVSVSAFVRGLMVKELHARAPAKTPREIEREQREAEKQQKLKRREIVARQQRIMKGVYKFDEYIAMEEGRLTRDELLSDADIDLAARLEGVDRSKYDHESSEPAVSPDELFERERAAYLARTSVVEPVDEWIED